MATRNIVPRATGEGGIGTAAKKWLNAYISNLNSPNLVIGSDADGDMYYRASSVLARLAKGTANLKLFMNAGATAPEWASGIKIVAFSRAAATDSGTVNYTGFGFKPSFILVLYGVDNTNVMGITATDGTVGGAIRHPRVSTNDVYYVSASTFAVRGTDGTNIQEGSFNSFISDGVAFNWVKTASGYDVNGIIIGFR